MRTPFRFQLIPEGAGPRGEVPLNIALVDREALRLAGWDEADALRAVARKIEGPAGMNVFDMTAITTTSDGLVVGGANVKMAAADGGRIHPEFGVLDMAPVEVTGERIREEPHLAPARTWFPGRPLFRGPDPSTRLLPVHNAVMTGRAVNNNSATEMMNVVTMEEILLPILGQLELMRGNPVMIGKAGEHISVGIAMTIAETWGRIFPAPQFRAGDTAHGSGMYSKTLKRHLPCIASPKNVLARRILRALDAGMIPGRHLGCSPAVLAVARAVGAPVDVANITPKAMVELDSVGSGRDFLAAQVNHITPDEVLERADTIIPGMEEAVLLPADQIATTVIAS